MGRECKDIKYDDVSVGMEIPSIRFPLTPQKLAIFAGVNRDFNPIHINTERARQAGAKDMYSNAMLIMSLFERMLREWAGLSAKIRKIGPYRMKKFTCAGNELLVRGVVEDKNIDEEGNKRVVLAVTIETEDDGVTVEGKATLIIPD